MLTASRLTLMLVVVMAVLPLAASYCNLKTYRVSPPACDRAPGQVARGASPLHALAPSLLLADRERGRVGREAADAHASNPSTQRTCGCLLLPRSACLMRLHHYGLRGPWHVRWIPKQHPMTIARHATFVVSAMHASIPKPLTLNTKPETLNLSPKFQMLN
jgi:hypothetical protein